MFPFLTKIRGLQYFDGFGIIFEVFLTELVNKISIRVQERLVILDIFKKECKEALLNHLTKRGVEAEIGEIVVIENLTMDFRILLFEGLVALSESVEVDLD